MDIKVYVTTLKKYRMPDDEIYIPMQVGAAIHEKINGYQSDNAGGGISYKNPTYSEYTAFYWIWKNVQCDIVGLNQYRRYFTSASRIKIMLTRDKYSLLLKKSEIESIFDSYDCIMPKKTNRGSETILSQYCDSEYGTKEEMDAVKEAIDMLYPEYTEVFEETMNSHYGYFRSIFFMRKELFDKYARWLFDILEYVEEKYNFQTPRVYGYLGERLINVFLGYEKVRIKEVNYINMETHLGLWYIKVLKDRIKNTIKSHFN